MDGESDRDGTTRATATRPRALSEVDVAVDSGNRTRETKMTAVVERVQTLWGSTVQFLREVRVELKKVTWPARNEIIGSTAVVIVASFVVAFFLGFVDLLLQKALGLIIK
jgi:preprotein translocase subunit SecE